jgi:hypothetical protein
MSTSRRLAADSDLAGRVARPGGPAHVRRVLPEPKERGGGDRCGETTTAKPRLIPAVRAASYLLAYSILEN